MQTHIIKVVIFCVASFFINGAFLYGDDKTCPDVFTGKGNFTLQEHCSEKEWNYTIDILNSDGSMRARFDTECNSGLTLRLLSGDNELALLSFRKKLGDNYPTEWEVSSICGDVTNQIATILEGHVKAEIDT